MVMRGIDVLKQIIGRLDKEERRDVGQKLAIDGWGLDLTSCDGRGRGQPGSRFSEVSQVRAAICHLPIAWLNY